MILERRQSSDPSPPHQGVAPDEGITPGLPDGEEGEALYEPVLVEEGEAADATTADATESVTDSVLKSHPGMLIVPMVQVMPSSLVMVPSTPVPRAMVFE